MKEILRWFNPNIRMKRWLLVIFIGAITIGLAIHNILISTEMNFSTVLVTLVLLVLGSSLILIGFMIAQSKVLESVTGTNVIAESISNKRVAKIFEKKEISDINPKVCIIGTGSGLYNTIKAVKMFSSNISVLVPFEKEDIQQSLIKLAQDEKMIEELFLDNYFFEQVEFFKNKYGDYENSLTNISKIYNMYGKVIPISFDEIFIENKINLPELTLFAQNALKEADLIVFAPCDLYRELMYIFKVNHLENICRELKTKKIFISCFLNDFSSKNAGCMVNKLDLSTSLENRFFDYFVYNDENIKKREKENTTQHSKIVFDNYINKVSNDYEYNIQKLSDIISEIYLDKNN